jgi:hypothetical protein
MRFGDNGASFIAKQLAEAFMQNAARISMT